MVSKKFSKLLNNIIDKSWKLQESIEETFRGIGKGNYGRVIKMARKPEYDEYMKTCAITGAGILIIGIIGFSIYYLWTHLQDWVGGVFGF